MAERPKKSAIFPRASVPLPMVPSDAAAMIRALPSLGMVGTVGGTLPGAAQGQMFGNPNDEVPAVDVPQIPPQPRLEDFKPQKKVPAVLPVAPAEKPKDTGKKRMFSQRDAQERKDTIKWTKEGYSPEQIVQMKTGRGYAGHPTGKIYAGSTNVPGKLSDFSEEEQDLIREEFDTSPLKNEAGMTKDEDWREMFKPRRTLGAMDETYSSDKTERFTGATYETQDPDSGNWVQQQRPGRVVLQEHFGPDWMAKDGEATADTVARRAGLLRAEIPPESGKWQLPDKTSYGVAGRNTVIPVPGGGLVAPAGARTVSGPYGGGFAVNPNIPSAIPPATLPGGKAFVAVPGPDPEFIKRLIPSS